MTLCMQMGVCSHVPVWVRVCLSTFLHKRLGVSQNVSVPHEPPETSMCFRMCVYVCICVFASLRLWISKHIVWMAYVHFCVLLWVCASVEYISMTICYSVPTHRTVGICVYAYVYLCRHEMTPVGNLCFMFIFVQTYV